MSHFFFTPSAATPTQRNRRLLLALPAACALPALTACGGGADLSYDTEDAVYTVGVAIAPNKPHLNTSKPQPPGSTAPTFSVKPALPAGLALNTQSGVISGTPTKPQSRAAYTVTARNQWGSAEARLRITVKGGGMWVPAAPMASARTYACAAMLPDGKVLVAGGTDATGFPTATEIYDPVSATWSAGAPMRVGRENPMCVTLSDGRVLMFGGEVDSGEDGAAELYDPQAKTWTAAGRMNRSRRFATGHLLPSGKVLVVGGTPIRLSDVPIYDSVEMFDPLTRVWTLLSTKLSTPRYHHAAALLPDGQTLLVAGGNSATAELYKVDGTATEVISFAGGGNQAQEAVTLKDGSVLVASSSDNLSRRFNPLTSSWTTSTTVGGGRTFPSMTVLADGRVLLAGGTDSGGVDLKTAEIYNPDANLWSATAPMTSGRSVAAAVLLGDGSVLVVGGETAAGIVGTNEQYLP